MIFQLHHHAGVTCIHGTHELGILNLAFAWVSSPGIISSQHRPVNHIIRGAGMLILCSRLGSLLGLNVSCIFDIFNLQCGLIRPHCHGH